jgi:hypothetical protein
MSCSAADVVINWGLAISTLGFAVAVWGAVVFLFFKIVRNED